MSEVIVLAVQVRQCIHVKYGIPRGSVLGPLLFLCFSVDLKDAVNTSTVSMKLFCLEQ